MITIRIFDRNWKVRVMPNDKFTKNYGDDAAALTFFASREIVFNASDFTLETVRHEIWHAYRASLCTSAATLNLDQEEEVSAELFGNYSGNMTVHSKHVYESLLDEAEL